MVLDLALVGTGGMLPLPSRWLASTLLRYGAHLILFDCGEGTQISLRALGWGLKDIDLILISHLHGDHVLGVPGLLMTQGNAGRTAPVQVRGPAGLRRAIEGLRSVAPYLPFEVDCRELRSGEAFTFDGVSVRCVAAEHHVECLAYRLDVPRARRFLPERARALGVPLEAWKELQRERPVTVDGQRFEPSDVLGPARRGLSLGLVTDTRPTLAIQQLITGVDLLVCEGTYGSDDDQPRAVERKHMTFGEAATLAAAGARRLLLTHFSPALVEPAAYAECAQRIFADTLVGADHLSLSLRYRDD